MQCHRYLLFRFAFAVVSMCLTIGVVPVVATADPAPGWMWVWAPDTAPFPDTVYLRETFRLPSAPASATLVITADDSYSAYINGDKTPVAQGADWTTVQQINVTRQLTKGVNLLSVRAINTAGLAGVLYHLQITMPTGKVFNLYSNSRVRVSRRPPPGWNDPKFVDAAWSPAKEIAAGNAPPWGPLHGPITSDPSHLVRLWDIRSGLPPDQSPYVGKRIVGDRMLLATSVSSTSDMRMLGRAGFTLFQSDSNHISTDEDSPQHWNWTSALSAGRSVNSLGLDWCYAPHNAFPPEWYRKSIPFTRIQCLEHHLPVQAFSPWDPKWPGFVAANYDALAKQFSPDENGVKPKGPERDARPNPVAVSSLYVGIHGDYGEAGLLTGGRVAVPSQRAAWERTFGDTHDHLGWWCDDPVARQDFRQSMIKKYGDLASLNGAWKRSYKSAEEINYPIPGGVRPEAKREWLDFVEWYQSGVGRAIEINLGAARQRFPHSMLTLPAGFADENPRGGNDNSLIPKLAAKYSSDVRSTHGGFRPFAENAATMFGRLGSACRFYGVPFWTEPPGALTPDQEVGRIFEDISQGAKGHFEWAENAVRNIDVFYKYSKLLKIEKPVVDVAMFYPATAQKLRPDQGYAPLFAQACAYMRDFANFDIVDDRMVIDDCLSRYRVLALWEGTQADKATLDRIRDWVNAGGTLLAYDFGKVTTFDGDTTWWNDMFGYSRNLEPALLHETYMGAIPTQYRILVGEATSSEYLSDDGWEKPDAAVGADGITSRWTNKSVASLRVPVKQDIQYSLIIHAMVPPEGAGLLRTVLVNGRAIGQMSQTGEVTYRYVVPQSLLEDHPLTTIAFQCEMFTPTTAIRNHPDVKAVGVLIRSVQLVEQGQIPADDATGLPGQIRHELDPNKLRNAWAQLRGKGMTIYFPAQKKLLKGYMEVIRRAIYHLSDIDPTSGRRDALQIDDANDGVYATLFTDKILYYNPRDTRIVKRVTISAKAFDAWKQEVAVPADHTWTLTLEPHSIQAIYLAPETEELLFECEKFTDLGTAKPQSNPNCSPGVGVSCVSVPKSGQIGTRFAIAADAAGRYTLFTRCVVNNRPQPVDVSVDGIPVKLIDAQAGNTILSGVISLTAGAHTLTLRNRGAAAIDADFVLLTNDKTVAGYDFASHFTSVD